MPSYDYHNLGGINGVVDGPQVPYSKRGHDKDRVQLFIFECDPADPFTALVHVQVSVDEPPVTEGGGGDLTWSDVAQLDFVNEGGNVFLQLDVEAAQVRAVCKTGNYTGGTLKSIKTMR